MAKQIMDDEAGLKRRARRRLIGAVTLTTVIIVLLPMLLDSEPKLVGQDIELRIPNKDKVGEFLPRMNLSSASAPVAALPASFPAAAPVPAIFASQVAVAPPAVVAAKAPENKPAPAPAKPKEVAPEPKPVEKAQAEPQPGFVVQIGAFTKADSALYLQKKLSKEGFRIYTEKVADKTRVRAGPYATREAAEKVRHKLEAQGLHPDISPVP